MFEHILKEIFQFFFKRKLKEELGEKNVSYKDSIIVGEINISYKNSVIVEEIHCENVYEM